jgi:hypothetical protein
VVEPLPSMCEALGPITNIETVCVCVCVVCMYGGGERVSMSVIFDTGPYPYDHQ